MKIKFQGEGLRKINDTTHRSSRVGTRLVEKGSHHSHFKTLGWTAPPHSGQPNYLFRGFS